MDEFLDKINSREEDGKFIISLPVFDSFKLCGVMCITFFLIMFLGGLILFIITQLYALLYTSIFFAVILLLSFSLNILGGSDLYEIEEIIMWRDLDSLFVKLNNKKIKYPFEDIKNFSSLKEKGNGIYIESVSGPIIKIITYDFKDPIIEKATLEFNQCFDKLKIKEPLIPNDV